MSQSIAFFDIDNTIYDGFSYFELLEKQAAEKLINTQILDNAKVAMEKYRSKLQSYETTIIELLDIYATGLEGVMYDTILRSTKEFYTTTSKFFAYTRPIMEILRDSHDFALVTGEPQFVAEAVREHFDMQAYYSTEFAVQNGIFTGAITHYLASRHEKHDAIKHLMHGHGTKDSFAFGDSDGDIEMLRVVEYPICLNPTEALSTIASKEGWLMPTSNEVVNVVSELNRS